ncbi:3-keto-steroid reductase [Agyrium rufum]|nr:3-keto-steroid reductase [Agyrium rufum]
MAAPSRSKAATDADCTYILITGVNAGLGFAICCRLIDEFLSTRPILQTLKLIPTTRTPAKSEATIQRLRAYTAKHHPRPEQAARISYHPEHLDLTVLHSVRKAAQRLVRDIPRLDVVILNAGLAGFTGLDWPRAVWDCLTDLKQATVWPQFAITEKGWKTGKQLRRTPREQTLAELSFATSVTEAGSGHGEGGKQDDGANGGRGEEGRGEPVLGEIFCANVFGHYMLTHDLLPLSRRNPSDSKEEPGRIIWISSLEAVAEEFSLSDIQALNTLGAYRSSKRLTDFLALTSNLSGTLPYTSTFFSDPSSSLSSSAQTPSPPSLSVPDSSQPTMYVTQPGVCSTGIIALHPILDFFKVLGLYFSRLCGSPWQTVSSYTGAVSVVYLALALSSALPPNASAVKYGSSTDRWGRGRIKRTEVEGWGWNGIWEGSEDVRGMEMGWGEGRRRGAKIVSKEEREGFEEAGRECWRYLEGLRADWERLLNEDLEVGDVEEK